MMAATLSQSQTGSGSIKLTFRFIRSVQNPGTVTIYGKLRAKNMGSSKITDLAIDAAKTNNITLSTGSFYFGTLNSKSSLDSQEFTMSYQNSMTQEPTKYNIVWVVQFADSEGAQRTETVIFE
jgi:hypothetical protein